MWACWNCIGNQPKPFTYSRKGLAQTTVSMDEAELIPGNRSPPTHEPRVAVVGGGLVGALQALFLAKRNFQVDLYEKRNDIRTVENAEGRSINLALSTRGREALRELGLEDAVLKTALPMSSRMIHSLSGELSRQYYGKKGQSIYSVDRLNLNKLLLDSAEACPNVNVYFEHQLVRANLDKKELVFSRQSAARPEEFQVNCNFIFGCDGVHSTVRRQMMRWDNLNYSQEYIDHGYKELTLPPSDDGNFAMDEKSLHIWPRNEFMMIALPNLDHSFTLTLFMPMSQFKSIETEEDMLAFFMKYFADSVDLIGADKLVQDYFRNPVGNLVSVKCKPHFMAESTVILGDAAHAVVPFYGQGMNAGFEDCLIFYEALQKHSNNLVAAAKDYYESHWRDTHAIADFSMINYIEMRSRVLSRTFLIRKYVDNLIHAFFPNAFVPLYSMVAFTRIPYSEIVSRHHRQQRWISNGLFALKVGMVGGIFVFLFWASGVAVPLRYRILPCVVKCFVKDVVNDII